MVGEAQSAWIDEIRSIDGFYVRRVRVTDHNDICPLLAEESTKRLFACPLKRKIFPALRSCVVDANPVSGKPHVEPERHLVQVGPSLLIEAVSVPFFEAVIVVPHDRGNSQAGQDTESWLVVVQGLVHVDHVSGAEPVINVRALLPHREDVVERTVDIGAKTDTSC